MNAKQFWKLNPNFKFNRIFLFNQTKFNNYGNMTKFLFPLTKGNYNNNFINELTEDKNLDFLTQNLISKYKNEIICSPSNKNNNIKIIRSTILKNNSKIKQIDFNKSNISDELNNSLDFDINPYFSTKKQKNKNKNKNKILSNIKQNIKIKNNTEGNMNIKNKNKININNNSLNSGKSETGNLKLPYITTNISKKYILSLNNTKNYINEKNQINIEKSEKKNKRNNSEYIKNNKNKEIQRDIFNNINYYLDNKKSQLNVKDIQRNINDIKNAKEENQDYENLYSQIFIKTKIDNPSAKHTLNINDISKINVDNWDSEEIMKRKDKDKYIIYEQNKKYIEKNKIYDAMKYGAASIPNLALDKGFRNVKKLEFDVLNLKRTQLELPMFIKTNPNN